jgi:hypothetical protein
LAESIYGNEAALKRRKQTKSIHFSLLNLHNIDMPALPYHLNPPCLMVYGQNDPVVEGTLGFDSNNGLPESMHKIVFEQSGHFPMLDETSKFKFWLISLPLARAAAHGNCSRKNGSAAATEQVPAQLPYLRYTRSYSTVCNPDPARFILRSRLHGSLRIQAEMSEAPSTREPDPDNAGGGMQHRSSSYG